MRKGKLVCPQCKIAEVCIKICKGRDCWFMFQFMAKLFRGIHQIDWMDLT